MSEIIKVCAVEQLADGGMRTVESSDVQILVIRDGDNIYALKNECTHEEFPLSEGWVEDGCIFCAFHGAKFDLKSGDALSLPAYEAVQTFPVRVNNGMIEIEVD
jgi:nitrite reductase/ring-hydroxylating ferredoxin subunit